MQPHARGPLVPTIQGAKRGQRLETIPGTPPSLDEAQHNCAFAPRCGLVRPRRTDALPPNVTVGRGRMARCLLAEAAETVAAT